MARRKIKRRRGEGISISGPATVHVSRGVTLVIDAPEEARIARVKKRRKAQTQAAGQSALRRSIEQRTADDAETRR